MSACVKKLTQALNVSVEIVITQLATKIFMKYVTNTIYSGSDARLTTADPPFYGKFGCTLDALPISC